MAMLCLSLELGTSRSLEPIVEVYPHIILHSGPSRKTWPGSARRSTQAS